MIFCEPDGSDHHRVARFHWMCTNAPYYTRRRGNGLTSSMVVVNRASLRRVEEERKLILESHISSPAKNLVTDEMVLFRVLFARWLATRLRTDPYGNCLSGSRDETRVGRAFLEAQRQKQKQHCLFRRDIAAECALPRLDDT